jgi:hypothetical protein
VAIMLGAIVLVPVLYLVVPLWLVAGLLGLGVLSSIPLTWEPVLSRRWAIWLASLVLVDADVGALVAFGPNSMAFWLANNVLLTVLVIGATNL